MPVQKEQNIGKDIYALLQSTIATLDAPQEHPLERGFFGKLKQATRDVLDSLGESHWSFVLACHAAMNFYMILLNATLDDNTATTAQRLLARWALLWATCCCGGSQRAARFLAHDSAAHRLQTNLRGDDPGAPRDVPGSVSKHALVDHNLPYFVDLACKVAKALTSPSVHAERVRLLRLVHLLFGRWFGAHRCGPPTALRELNSYIGEELRRSAIAATPSELRKWMVGRPHDVDDLFEEWEGHLLERIGRCIAGAPRGNLPRELQKFGDIRSS
jgi:hypothetical protein